MTCSDTTVRLGGGVIGPYEVRRGESLALVVEILDEDDQPIDLTGATSHVRLTAEGQPPRVIPSSIGADGVELELTPEITATLALTQELGVSITTAGGRAIGIAYGQILRRGDI